MVFIEYPHEGIAFLFRFELIFWVVKKDFVVGVQDYNHCLDKFIKQTYKNM
jgi:hypothetical protein